MTTDAGTSTVGSHDVELNAPSAAPASRIARQSLASAAPSPTAASRRAVAAEPRSTDRRRAGGVTLASGGEPGEAGEVEPLDPLPVKRAAVEHSTTPRTRLGVATPQQLRDRRRPSSSRRRRTVDALGVGQRHDIVGAVGEAERSTGADPVAVATVVEREDAEVLGRRPVAAIEVDVGGGVQPWSRMTVGAPAGPGTSRSTTRPAGRSTSGRAPSDRSWDVPASECAAASGRLRRRHGVAGERMNVDASRP